MLALVVIMAILLAWALVAGRLARWSITAPLAMVVAGVALTAGSNPVFRFDLETTSSEHAVEVVLAILLFVDATETPGGIVGREPKLTASAARHRPAVDAAGRARGRVPPAARYRVLVARGARDRCRAD